MSRAAAYAQALKVAAPLAAGFVAGAGSTLRTAIRSYFKRIPYSFAKRAASNTVNYIAPAVPAFRRPSRYFGPAYYRPSFRRSYRRRRYRRYWKRFYRSGGYRGYRRRRYRRSYYRKK